MSDASEVGASAEVSNTEPGPSGPDAPPCVLVVDDDPDMIRLLRAALATRGVGCVVAYDAKQGFMAAQKHRPRLVLVDWHMPAGGGRLLLRHLRGHAPTREIPVFVVTGDGSPSVDADAAKHGARGVLRKPVNVMELLDLITPISREPAAE